MYMAILIKASVGKIIIRRGRALLFAKHKCGSTKEECPS